MSKDKTVKKGKPEFLTPEYIAEQRALREARKKAKRDEKEHLPVDPNAFNTDFIKRDMLQLPTKEYPEGKTFKIMSYNALAQCLIRRELFPENGKAVLKWKNRSQTLINELEYYNPDIVCLQEVDKDKAATFWKDELHNKLGLTVVFKTLENKNHGQVIAFRGQMFELADERLLNYDKLDTPGAEKQFTTKNTGMITALKFKEPAETPGLVVGTTHMFWHPMGSYERTRQMALFVKEATKYSESEYPEWPVFLAGDYNSECFDTPYLSATCKRPVTLDLDAVSILMASGQHRFKPNTEEGKEDAEHPDQELVDEVEARRQLNALVDYFNSIPYTAQSLYKWYKEVHPTNVHPKGNGEPVFSNWAHAWRGLLDYIFVMRHESETSPDDEVKQGVKLLELLRLPEPQEMGAEPSGQPREGQYPSDHLCIMAKVQVL